MTAFDLTQAFAPQHIARRLAVSFDEAQLAADLARMDEGWWGAHEGPYHDGQWESISLWAPGGDLRQQRSFGAPFAATEALERCTYVPSVLAAFACEKNRIRLMRLRAGGRILRHSDPVEQIDQRLLRVHVPIQTSDAVHFLVNDRRIVMKPGEAWHIDVRFPHEVHNGGTSPRVHLVMDLVGNAATAALLEAAESQGTGSLAQYYMSQLKPRA